MQPAGPIAIAGRAHSAGQAQSMTLWPPLCCYAGSVTGFIHFHQQIALPHANPGEYPSGVALQRAKNVVEIAKKQTAPRLALGTQPSAELDIAALAGGVRLLPVTGLASSGQPGDNIGLTVRGELFGPLVEAISGQRHSRETLDNVYQPDQQASIHHMLEVYGLAPSAHVSTERETLKLPASVWGRDGTITVPIWRHIISVPSDKAKLLLASAHTTQYAKFQVYDTRNQSYGPGALAVDLHRPSAEIRRRHAAAVWFTIADYDVERLGGQHLDLEGKVRLLFRHLAAACLTRGEPLDGRVAAMLEVWEIQCNAHGAGHLYYASPIAAAAMNGSHRMQLEGPAGCLLVCSRNSVDELIANSIQLGPLDFTSANTARQPGTMAAAARAIGEGAQSSLIAQAATAMEGATNWAPRFSVMGGRVLDTTGDLAEVAVLRTGAPISICSPVALQLHSQPGSKIYVYLPAPRADDVPLLAAGLACITSQRVWDLGHWAAVLPSQQTDTAVLPMLPSTVKTARPLLAWYAWYGGVTRGILEW